MIEIVRFDVNISTGFEAVASVDKRTISNANIDKLLIENANIDMTRQIDISVDTKFTKEVEL